jgi:hypothetical protein
VASHEEVLAAYPSLTAWPALSLTHLVAVGLAVVGGLASPAPAEPAVVAA